MNSKQIAQISRLYHQYMKLKSGFDFAYDSGRFSDSKDLARRIVGEIIPECKKVIPLSVQKQLEMVVGELEERYQRYLD